jgi:hypothetical protein
MLKQKLRTLNLFSNGVMRKTPLIPLPPLIPLVPINPEFLKKRTPEKNSEVLRF